MNGNEDILAQLSALIDGELTEAEAGRAQEAARRDEAIAAELRQLRATRRLVRHLPRVRAPGDFADRVLQRVERRHLLGAEPAPAAGRQFRTARYLSAAAAMLLAAGVAFIVLLTVHLSRRPADELAATVPGLPDPTVPGTEGYAQPDRRNDLGARVHARPDGTKGGDFGGRKPSAEGGSLEKDTAPDARLGRPIAREADADTFRFLVQPAAGQEANHLVILTNDLAAADRQVKELLCSALPTGASRAGGWDGKAGAGRGKALDYGSPKGVQDGREVRYEVVLAASDVPRFRRQLGALGLKQRRGPSLGAGGEDAAGAAEQRPFQVALAKTGLLEGPNTGGGPGLLPQEPARRRGTDEPEKIAEAAPAAVPDDAKNGGPGGRGRGAEPPPPARPVEAPEPAPAPAVRPARPEPPRKSPAEQPAEPKLRPVPAPTPPAAKRSAKDAPTTVAPVAGVAGVATKPGEQPPPGAQIERHPAKGGVAEGIDDLTQAELPASQPGPADRVEAVKAKAHAPLPRATSAPAMAAGTARPRASQHKVEAEAPPHAATAPAPVRFERLVITLRLAST